MDNQNVAFGTIPAVFVDRCRVSWLNMDEQGHFAHQGLARTVWAGGKSRILVGIQDEPVLWRQFSQFRQGNFLFSQDYLAYTVMYSLSPKFSPMSKHRY